MRRACKLMHNTGADDTQYVLVRIKDLEELMDAWEREQLFKEKAREVKKNGLKNSGEEKSGRKSTKESRTKGDSKGSGNRNMDHKQRKEKSAEANS